jgi:hypothetical protein
MFDLSDAIAGFAIGLLHRLNGVEGRWRLQSEHPNHS